MEVNASEIFTHWFSEGKGGGWARAGGGKSLTAFEEHCREMILFRELK